jgi:hypothetical protein
MSVDYRKLLKDVLRGCIVEQDLIPEPHCGPMQAWFYDPLTGELIDDSGVQWTTDEEEQAFLEIVAELREEYQRDHEVNPVAGSDPASRERREKWIFDAVLD